MRDADKQESHSESHSMVPDSSGKQHTIDTTTDRGVTKAKFDGKAIKDPKMIDAVLRAGEMSSSTDFSPLENIANQLAHQESHSMVPDSSGKQHTIDTTTDLGVTKAKFDGKAIKDPKMIDAVLRAGEMSSSMDFSPLVSVADQLVHNAPKGAGKAVQKS